jgi:hypothetical protein
MAHSTPLQPPSAGNDGRPQDLRTPTAPGPDGPDLASVLRIPPDPSAATGPPWPRLVAAGGGYAPPWLLRWPVVLGIVLLVGWVAAQVILRSPSAVSPRGPAAPYQLTAADGRFTATFPGRAQRKTQTAGTITVITYLTQASSHAIGVTAFRLPVSVPFSINRAVTGMAASLPGGKVISRSTVTYHGHPAEDATITFTPRSTFSAGFAQVRVVRLGSFAYALQGYGPTLASFAHDYQVLLRTFTPRS